MTFTWKLIRSELRLFLREPSAMAFVLAFPVVTVLILGGVFDEDDPAFLPHVTAPIRAGCPPDTRAARRRRPTRSCTPP